MDGYKLEVCLDSIDSAVRAQEGGADRIELCDNMFHGGTTPSYGVIKVVREVLSIDMNVIIRPRGGDFLYSERDFQSMLYDIELCKTEGVDGVVFGILLENGDIDTKRCKTLIEAAKPMSATFHRAFDVARDPFKAMEDIINLGFDRILTSGQEPSVLEGSELITQLIERAGDRIIIMPGCGIKTRNFKRIHTLLGAKEYHVQINEALESSMVYRSNHVYMGGSVRSPEYYRDITSRDGINFLSTLYKRS